MVVVGLTGDVTGVPPQLTVNHSTVSPLPTLADSVEDPPEQIAGGVAAGLVGVAGSGFTVTVVVAQVEFPQLFSQRTQYCVVEVGLTAMEVPELTYVPPQLPVYHLQVVPNPPVAVSVLLTPEQMVAGLADADVGATGGGLTGTVKQKQVELPQLFSHLTQ